MHKYYFKLCKIKHRDYFESTAERIFKQKRRTVRVFQFNKNVMQIY